MQHLDFSDLKDKVTVITGGAGILGQAIAMGLASAGAITVLVYIDPDAAGKVAAEITRAAGTISLGIKADVLNKQSLIEAREKIHAAVGKISFLINGAGGNSPAGTTPLEEMNPEQAGNPEGTFFGLEIAGMEKIFNLNYFGTLLPTSVFAADMVEAGIGAILNISSLSAFHPLTKVAAYSSAKAAINNFTEWLAVHMGKTGVRVNAIAPGFFLTNQNRFLLIDEKTGDLSARGRKIMAATPMGRFGTPDELQGAVAFLLSGMARYITGTVMLIDGGYNAYSGV